MIMYVIIIIWQDWQTRISYLITLSPHLLENITRVGSFLLHDDVMIWLSYDSHHMADQNIMFDNLTRITWCSLSYSGYNWRCYRRYRTKPTNNKRTREDRAPQPLNAGWLNFAKWLFISYFHFQIDPIIFRPKLKYFQKALEDIFNFLAIPIILLEMYDSLLKEMKAAK